MFWYEDEIKRLERVRTKVIREPDTLFYGSSSIRLWTSLAKDLEEFNPVNLGFGGSTMAACTWFFDRVMVGYKPQRLVLYAGDNDLGDGRHPEEVFIFFQQLAAKTTKRFGDIPCYFISLKPSFSRWNMADQFRFTNKIISEDIASNHPDWHFIDVFNPMLNVDGKPNAKYFAPDGLHLSAQGYALWSDIIKKAISS
ncbi:SGNH/GDSL hydrolase family protein [Mucilaginibacter agri]|uniref:GDSL family lipase n=1 Tax=Mucilaginibacter agri TaxID=2695265 RepID=A0A966DSK8_9SPHI|nr:SGNH/GDSL hydrolase family protein [Mucilaginibacter agri]NCD70253.1 GDSL family lipase [Mucilaginibacter agri]